MTLSRPVESLRFAASENELRSLWLTLAVLEGRIERERQENARLRAANLDLSKSLDDTARLADEARHLAYHDGLTGLPNRLLLMKRLRLAIDEALSSERHLALLFIDVDDFKGVNDVYGHDVGDQLLELIGTRIGSRIGEGDLACRYGGDEFVVLLSDVLNPERALAAAAEIQSHLQGEYRLDDVSIQVTASIGVSIFPSDGRHEEALLTSADSAMYRNKALRPPVRLLPVSHCRRAAS